MIFLRFARLFMHKIIARCWTDHITQTAQSTPKKKGRKKERATEGKMIAEENVIQINAKIIAVAETKNYWFVFLKKYIFIWLLFCCCQPFAAYEPLSVGCNDIWRVNKFKTTLAQNQGMKATGNRCCCCLFHMKEIIFDGNLIHSKIIFIIGTFTWKMTIRNECFNDYTIQIM